MIHTNNVINNNTNNNTNNSVSKTSNTIIDSSIFGKYSNVYLFMYD